jgi:hypothetical protein
MGLALGRAFGFESTIPQTILSKRFIVKSQFVTFAAQMSRLATVD